MARAGYANVVADSFGSRVAGATVEVRQPGTATPLGVPLYVAATGAATLANPFTADGQGFFSFYLDVAQAVDLYVTASGYGAHTEAGVAVAVGAPVLDGSQLVVGSVTAAQIADGTLTDADVASANKDGTAATPSLRTLGTGTQQAAAGNHDHPASVSSVGLTMPAEFGVSGSPITTSGTLAVSKASQAANQVYAGPASGAAAQPGFRALVPADLGGAWTSFTPGLDQNGARSATVVVARYAIFGKLAVVRVSLNVTGAGSAGSVVILTGIPAAIAPLDVSFTRPVGQFVYYDTGTAYYVGAVIQVAPTQLKFLTDGRADYLGASPSFATANGDELHLTACWELARWQSC